MKRMDDKNKCSLPHRFPFLFLRFVCCLCMCACASLSLSLSSSFCLTFLSSFEISLPNFHLLLPTVPPPLSNQHRPLPQGHLRPHSLPPVLRRFESGVGVSSLSVSLRSLPPTGSASASLVPYSVHPFYLVQCAPRPVFRVSRSSLQQASLLLLWLCVSPSSSPPLPLAGPAQVRASSRLAVEAVGSQPPFPLSPPPFPRRPPAQAAAASNPLVPVLH